MVARTTAQRIPHDLRIHVGVTVDEAGETISPSASMVRRRRVGDAADLGDAASGDADVGDEALAARAVDDGAAAHQKIQGHGLLQLASDMEAAHFTASPWRSCS